MQTVYELQVMRDDRTGPAEVIRSELFADYWTAVRWAEIDRLENFGNPSGLGRFYRLNSKPIHYPAPTAQTAINRKSQQTPTPTPQRSERPEAGPKGRSARKGPAKGLKR